MNRCIRSIARWTRWFWLVDGVLALALPLNVDKSLTLVLGEVRMGRVCVGGWKGQEGG